MSEAEVFSSPYSNICTEWGELLKHGQEKLRQIQSFVRNVQFSAKHCSTSSNLTIETLEKGVE